MPSFQFDYNKAHIQQEVVYYPMCGTSFTVFGKNNCDIRSKKNWLEEALCVYTGPFMLHSLNILLME